MAVLDWVEVDVIAMPGKIAFVAQGVLPITALPDPAFASAQSTGRDPLPSGNAREKPALINCQRTAKSQSPSGNVQIA
jgi:hypothetical protein